MNEPDKPAEMPIAFDNLYNVGDTVRRWANGAIDVVTEFKYFLPTGTGTGFVRGGVRAIGPRSGGWAYRVKDGFGKRSAASAWFAENLIEPLDD